MSYYPLSCLLALLLCTQSSLAYWRMSCGLSQTGRLDPIVSPGKISGHVHKIVGASNIGLSSDYDSLQNASCTTCSVQKDKSAYWTPLLYYQHKDGSFEEVPNSGMTVYYLGRGDNKANIKPFPPGFRMLSGNAGARSYNPSALTYKNNRPISDQVSYACLDAVGQPETPGMNNTSCRNGLRAQIHFQSCWDGVNLYKSDNSHVAHMSQIDNGACPPGYPVQLIHLFYEVLYGVNDIKQDGGQFVFAQGDTTGFGFHGDFLNGWDEPTLTAAIAQCANTDNGGAINACAPLNAVDDPQYAWNCPPQPQLIDEPTRGTIAKLPGCNNVTSGPAPALSAACPSTVQPPSVNTVPAQTGTTKRFTPSIGTVVSGWQYLGYASEGSGTRALANAAYTNATGMTSESCQTYCTAKGYPLAGVEYGRECYCGKSLDSSSKLNITTCQPMTCSGNSSEICGGPSCLSVWNNTKPATSAAASASASASASSTVGSSTYLGCANEVSGRALTGASFTNSTGMTNQACATFCQAGNYHYFGTEYASQCYCGNTINAGSTVGQTGCTMPCTGSKDMCGGPSRISLYNNTLYKPVQVVPSVATYTSQGCYTEGTKGRALSSASYSDGKNMTVESCVGFCKGKGQNWAGIEYGAECYCGSGISNGGAPASDGCSMLCKGSIYEYCGGPSRLNVYKSS